MNKNDYKSIDEYIQCFPKDVQEKLNGIRVTIMNLAAETKESISYGIPTLKVNNKVLVHFAAYPTHIGLYPTPAVVLEFGKELGNYKTSKGTIQFKLDEEIPLRLIEKMVLYRIKQLSEK